jgi:DNA polymerase-1
MPKEKEEKKLIVLLDAHAIIHRAYHALPDFASSKGEPTGALYGLSSMLIKIIGDLKPDYLAACFDLPKPTYRHEAFDGYKVGRKKTDDELVAQLKRARDVFTAFHIPIYDLEGFEADDLLGTIAERLKKDPTIKVIIASGDSDTLQLIDDGKVQVFTLKKGINDTILYDEAAVNTKYGFGPLQLTDYKGLAGDSSDNIPGIKGIGDKTATTLIQKFGTIEEMYKVIKKDPNALKAAGIKPKAVELITAGEEEALFSKMLGTIRRDAPVKFSLPEKVWRENIDIKDIEKLFAELEFRTLGNRVKELLRGEALPEVATPTEKVKEVPVEEEKVDPKELRETALALWVADSNITTPELSDIKTFAQKDTFAEAREVVMSELKKRGGQKVFDEIEKPLIPIVDEMNHYGVKIDKAYLGELSKEYTKELKAIEKKIIKLAGEEFNVASPKQLGVILFEKLGLKAKNQKKTAGGAMSTKESELEKLRDLHPIIAHILEYREIAKLLGTYIDAIPELLDPNNRLHATFQQEGSATGRMSSHNPGLQNIPIRSARGERIRNAFIAEKDCEVVSFDYSQIQLRVAAFLSGDAKLIQIFKNGEDIHTSVAAEVFGVSPDKVDYEMRRRAKVINFGIIYGMGVNALKANLTTETVQISRAEAQKFYDDYFKTFSTLATYLDEVKATAQRQGYTETFFGRRRYFEGIKSKIPFIRAAAERMAVNAPIQGTEADIVKIAMVRIDEALKKGKLENDVHLVLQVHDELVYEIKKSYVKEAAVLIKDIMQSVIPLKEIKGVPILAEAYQGKNWGEMEKIA